MKVLSELMRIALQLQSRKSCVNVRVLIVEDEPAVAHMWRQALLGHCEAVDICDRQAIAIEALIDGDYDILVLDWRLPNGDSQALFQYWVQNIHGPVVIISGFLDKEDQIELMNMGAWNVLPKPEAAHMFQPLMFRYINWVKKQKLCDDARRQLNGIRKMNVLFMVLILIIALGPELYGLL